jgi:hypothetical protein
MTIHLPQPVAAYFAADTADGEAVSRCFSEDGVVIDEKRTHRGRTAIARWKTEASRKYTYVAEPLAVDESEGRIRVTCRVTGNFPGSPVDLRFFFVLGGDTIASLEIVP